MNWVIKNIAFTLVVLTGCMNHRSDQLSPGQYIQFVEQDDNLLRSTVRSGIWSYTFQYKPGTYIALKELDADSINQAVVESRARSLEHTIWFNIHFAVDGKGEDPLKYKVSGLQDYNQRLEYFLKRAAGNFQLQYGDKGMMTQAGYYFENNYNVKPEVVLIIGFKIPDASPQESVTLAYADELFNAGILKFNIAKETFLQIPKLSIQ
jgi:hypothetical protein